MRGPEVGGVVDANRTWTRPVLVVVRVTPRHINPACGSRNRGMVVVVAILLVMPRPENLAKSSRPLTNGRLVGRAGIRGVEPLRCGSTGAKHQKKPVPLPQTVAGAAGDAGHYLIIPHPMVRKAWKRVGIAVIAANSEFARACTPPLTIFFRFIGWVRAPSSPICGTGRLIWGLAEVIELRCSLQEKNNSGSSVWPTVIKLDFFLAPVPTFDFVNSRTSNITAHTSLSPRDAHS